MAKTSGLGDNLYVGSADLSGDIGSVSSVRGSQALLDFTSINQSAFDRELGLRDGGIDFNAWLNKTGAHINLSALPRTDTLVSYFRGTTLGNAAACCIAKEIDYPATRNADGSLSYAVTTLANGYGLEWGKQLTAGKVTLTGSSTTNKIDFGATEGTTAFGAQAYIHVFAFTGTSATIKLQSSTDDGAGDAYADITGGAFTTVTGPGFERIQTGRTASIERYVRLNVAGTFTNLQIAVVLVKNTATVTY